nr:enkurin TRPC channel interacting protein [Hymenolepis microstoma]
MHDKAGLSRPPEKGTCCFRIKPTGKDHQAPEYIYNLLFQHSKSVKPEKLASTMFRKDPPPLSDAVPKASHKTMGLPGSFCFNNKDKLLQKKPFILKHSKKLYVDQDCVKMQVKETAKAFEKLKLEQPEGRIRDACCAGVKPRLPVTQKYSQRVECIEVPYRTNWIERNAISNITRKPGERVSDLGRKIFVDRNKGDRQAIVSTKTHSGLEKRFVYKPTYGKVPEYLKRRKEILKASREQYSHYLNEKALQNTEYMLTEAERDELLKDLKNAWDSYNAKFLLLSSNESTGKKQACKEYLENQLKSLEADIKMIEAHKYIFVEADKSPGADAAAATANEIPIENN